MTDEELQSLNRRGFFPGPSETEEEFLRRISLTEQVFLSLTESPVSASHWEWVRVYLGELFDFSPYSLPAFYSNRSLTPWQGAVSWIENKNIVTIQLRRAFQKGSFLGIYSREEILAHESVHAARAAFVESRFEEFFAYMTSESRWRQVFGPIVQKPWEVWPFALFCIAGVFDVRAFFGASVWAALGFFRLIKGHWVLRKASCVLRKWVDSEKKIRSLLLRLTDKEIQSLAKGISIQKFHDSSLRWKLLSSAYLNGTLEAKDHPFKDGLAESTVV